MFYVYLYIREDGTPYYVGKGKGKRAYVQGGRPCKKPTDKSRIKIHTDNLTEDQAFSLEKELIITYGRKCDGGILHNKSLGGEGSSGRIPSKATRKKMSKASLGVSKSENHKENIRLANIGEKNPMWGKSYKKTPDQIEKTANAIKKKIIIDGVEYDSAKDASEILGIPRRTISARVKSNNFSNYIFKSNHKGNDVQPYKKGCYYNGEYYETTTALSNHLGISRSTVKYRCKNNLFGFRYP